MTIIETTPTKRQLELTAAFFLDVLYTHAPDRVAFTDFRLPSEWYPIDPQPAQHRVDHHIGVALILNGYLAICESIGVRSYSPFERGIFREVARTHDMARLNDENDPDHGNRAADLILEPDFPMREALKRDTSRIVRQHPLDDIHGKDDDTLTFNKIDSLFWVRTDDFHPDFLFGDPVAFALLPLVVQLCEKNMAYKAAGWPEYEAIIQTGIDMRLLR